MKRLLIVIMCMIFGVLKIHAQAKNDTTLTMTYFSGDIRICSNLYDRLLLYAPANCTDFTWYINGEWIVNESPVIFDKNVANTFVCAFSGCGFTGYNFGVRFIEPNVPAATTTELWKRQHESTMLDAPSGSYTYLWNTGETTATIEVTEPGTYICEVSDMCATSEQTFIVQDNVEIYRSTVDLETNLNKVTWQVTDEQAGYINQVKVERDGFVVGTAPYTDGFFLDNIGSENAARNYRVTGILHDGSECPIPSYQKGTLHVDYSPNASNPNKLNMAWTAPFIEEGAPLSVTYFQICKYDSNTHEITVIDQLGANNTIGSYDYSLFDSGYATVAALFSDAKDYENVSFSNLTEEILGVGEVCVTPFKIYPNPSQGNITVEGNGHLSVRNVLGQEIFTKEIEGLINLELSKGIYFVEMNGRTQKVVVE